MMEINNTFSMIGKRTQNSGIETTKKLKETRNC